MLSVWMYVLYGDCPCMHAHTRRPKMDVRTIPCSLPGYRPTELKCFLQTSTCTIRPQQFFEEPRPSESHILMFWDDRPKATSSTYISRIPQTDDLADLINLLFALFRLPLFSSLPPLPVVAVWYVSLPGGACLRRFAERKLNFVQRDGTTQIICIYFSDRINSERPQASQQKRWR